MIPVFDARCTVGRHLLFSQNGPHTVRDLISEMDKYGNSEALVLDSLYRENHPDDGNRCIIDIALFSPRLHPAWSALPAYGRDEKEGPDRLLFGSDLQGLPMAQGLRPILFAGIPVEQKRMILSDNLERILQSHSLIP